MDNQNIFYHTLTTLFELYQQLSYIIQPTLYTSKVLGMVYIIINLLCWLLSIFQEKHPNTFMTIKKICIIFFINVIIVILLQLFNLSKSLPLSFIYIFIMYITQLILLFVFSEIDKDFEDNSKDKPKSVRNKRTLLKMGLLGIILYIIYYNIYNLYQLQSILLVINIIIYLYYFISECIYLLFSNINIKLYKTFISRINVGIIKSIFNKINKSYEKIFNFIFLFNSAIYFLLIF